MVMKNSSRKGSLYDIYCILGFLCNAMCKSPQTSCDYPTDSRYLSVEKIAGSMTILIIYYIDRIIFDDITSKMMYTKVIYIGIYYYLYNIPIHN